MFRNKKRLQEIEKEKQELLFIKQQLEDITPKVDISNIYVWQAKGIYNIVKLDIQRIRGIGAFTGGKEVDGYESTLVDIFSNNVIYQKVSMEKIKRVEYIAGERREKGYEAILMPLHEIDKNILAYTDKKVPLYVLQQLYYKINNIDINTYTLKREK